MPEQDRTIEILRRVALFLKGLTEEEAEDLANGRVRLELVGRPSRRHISKDSSAEALDIEALCKELAVKATREEGMTLLDSLNLTRESLRRVAAAVDAPTPKTDTVQRLKERIVEATIGYRLRSKAIRNSG